MKLSLLIFSLLFTQLVYCCSCDPLEKINDAQFNQYNIIFKGTVIKIQETTFEKIISFKVATYYKGQKKTDTIRIISPKQSGECGIFPKSGEQWLIFAYSSENKIRTNLCTRTKNMNARASDLDKETLKNDLDFLDSKLKRNSS